MTGDEDDTGEAGEADETSDLFGEERAEREDAVDDPFAELGAGVDDGSLDDGSLDDGSLDDDSLSPDSGRAEPVASSSERGHPGQSKADPFSDLGEGDEGTDAELADAFERMDVGGVADEDVWKTLDEDAADDPFGPTAAADSEGLSDRWDSARGDDGVERVIDKRAYCQQCPHFTAPPDVACSHEGTTIAEVVGFDEFRVRNCPMVSDDDPTFEDRR